MHTDHSINMVEEPKLDIRRKRLCSVTSHVSDFQVRTLHWILLCNPREPTCHARCMATQKSAHDSAQANPTHKPKIQRTPDRSICRSFESAANVSDKKKQTLAHSDIQALVRACDVNIFDVLQGTLRTAHAVTTTMAESRVLGEHLVSESLRVLLSHHEVSQGHEAEKQERITCRLQCQHANWFRVGDLHYLNQKTCRMRTTRAPSKNWKGILRRTQSQTKRPARSTVPNHVARDSTEARATQRPRSHTAPKVKGETQEAREYNLGFAHGMRRNNTQEPTSHTSCHPMPII